MLVNICMITYNHENFIAEAIESALMQQTDFEVKIVIGEDSSTDNTRSICEHFAEKYPDKIMLLPAEKNLGMMKNFLRTYRECKGAYIAFLEGDDYWTDNLKLQKQVDFLEANLGISLCFHNVEVKENRNGTIKEFILHKHLVKDEFDTSDILGPWFIPSLSAVFVNYPDLELPDWYFNCQYGDLPFMLLLSLRGKFRYLNEVMGVYRLHDNGMTTVHANYDKIILMVYIYASFNIYTGNKYLEAVRKACIYEIDRHVPKPVAEVQPLKKAPPKNSLSGKVKRVIGLLNPRN